MAVVVTRLVPLALTVMIGGGCRMHRVHEAPLPPITMPTSWSGGGGAGAGPDEWWRTFGDDGLDTAVGQALGKNLDLRSLWAVLEQARASTRQLGALALPEITASASVGRSHRSGEFMGVGYEQTTSTFDLSVGAGYELDLWKRVDSAETAAERDLIALRDDIEAIAVTIAATVTELWLDVRYYQARRTVLTGQLDVNQKSLDLLDARFREGLGSALDVYQQRSLLSSTRVQMLQNEAALVVVQGQLAILLSTTVGEVGGLVSTAPDTLPDAPPVPDVGVPASLLDRRPDVRATRRRVEAADYRVAAAVADRLPALRLSASAGLSSNSFADLVTSPFYSLLAGVTQPLFDHGRRKAEVVRTRAVVEQRLAEYGQAMVQAMAEVEIALGQEHEQAALIAELVSQAELAAATVREARTAYREGSIDYLPVLNALQGEQQVALATLQSRRQLLSLRVSLYRALGGSWTESLKPPAPPGVP